MQMTMRLNGYFLLLVLSAVEVVVVRSQMDLGDIISEGASNVSFDVVDVNVGDAVQLGRCLSVCSNTSNRTSHTQHVVSAVKTYNFNIVREIE